MAACQDAILPHKSVVKHGRVSEIQDLRPSVPPDMYRCRVALTHDHLVVHDVCTQMFEMPGLPVTGDLNGLLRWLYIDPSG